MAGARGCGDRYRLAYEGGESTSSSVPAEESGGLSSGDVTSDATIDGVPSFMVSLLAGGDVSMSSVIATD